MSFQESIISSSNKTEEMKCVEKLTDAQRELAEQHYRYIYYFMQKQNLDEDYFDIVAIGLCKAARSYTKEKGIPFMTYAYTVMLNEVKQEWRRNKNKIKPTVYFEDSVPATEGDTAFKDILGDPSDHISELETSMLMKQALSHIKNERDKNIVCMYMNGKRQADIAKHCGLSQSYVSRIIKSVKNFCKTSLQTEKGVVQYSCVRYTSSRKQNKK